MSARTLVATVMLLAGCTSSPWTNFTESPLVADACGQYRNGCYWRASMHADGVAYYRELCPDGHGRLARWRP